ncbi:MAG: M23 family peptidase [Chloroflexi bacterium]|nr:M23 family metallopeptidase [Chloroflexota bacterium]MQC18218.1 M23 family peptidase [Chloroflexota bacterium]MQC48269.1 M23 family peptidase [Chloroflexota bacterium]
MESEHVAVDTAGTGRIGRVLARPVSRRRLLVRALRGVAGGAVLVPLTACDRLIRTEERPEVAITEATPVPPQSPTPTPEPTPVLELPVVTLDPAEIGQGETVMIIVRHSEARGGRAELLGQRMPLTRDGDLLWAVVGAGLLTPLGTSEATVVMRGADGGVLHEVRVPFTVAPVDRPVDYLTASPEVTAVLTVEAVETEAALRTYEQFNLFQSRPRWAARLRQPCEGFITTAFGQGRSLNGGPVTGQHSGTDIANEAGTPIVAAADGRIAWAGWMPIRGNSVLIDHGAGVVTGYHHLLEIDVAEGDDAEAGQQIARMGSTGFSTGPHLHWEMTIYGVNVDPMTWTERVFRPAAR